MFTPSPHLYSQGRYFLLRKMRSGMERRGEGKPGPGIPNGSGLWVPGEKYFPEKFSCPEKFFKKFQKKNNGIAGISGKAILYIGIFTK